MADTIYEALSITSEDNDNVIIPGTTPRLVIKINDSLMDLTTQARIDINQSGKTIDQIRDVEISGHQIAYTLSQEETYRMTPNIPIQLQVHGLTSEELAWKTQVFTINVGETLTGTMIGLNN